MKIVVISNSRQIEDETKIVHKLFENGLQTFHLRKPKFSTRQLKNYILEIPKKYHSKIIIHSHHSLARKFQLKGIHLTKSHQQKAIKTWFTLKLLKMKNPDLVVTASYNKLSSLSEIDKRFNYVFLSPIFDSLSSKYQSGFTEQSLKVAMKKTTHEVIARGGIEIDNIQKVNEIGFRGMAFYSAIWKKSDPVAEFNRILQKCNEMGISPE